MALTRATHLRTRRSRALGRPRWVLGQAAIVVAAVVVYFGVRGLTEGSRAVDHARSVLSFEQLLGIDVEDAVQGPFAHPGVLQTMANWAYMWGHWPVIVATMVWLGFRHAGILLRLRNAIIVPAAWAW